MNIKSLVVVFFMGFCRIYAQDTIKFVNKQILATKVDEVGTTEIHYHRYDNLSGPIYISKKENIQWIKYSNGQVDSFKVAEKKAEVVTNETFTVYNPKSNINSDKIVVYSKKLFYHQNALGDKPLLQLISSYPNQQKKNILLKEYLNMKNFQRRQYLFGFGGAGVGIALLYGGSIVLLNSYNSTGYTGALMMISAVPIFITSQVISGINKRNRAKKKIEIASIYNQ